MIKRFFVFPIIIIQTKRCTNLCAAAFPRSPLFSLFLPCVPPSLLFVSRPPVPPDHAQPISVVVLRFLAALLCSSRVGSAPTGLQVQGCQVADLSAIIADFNLMEELLAE
jgi:hypothetical protein